MNPKEILESLRKYNEEMEKTGTPAPEFARMGFKCPVCGQITIVKARPEDYADFQNGKKLIQEAFPYLSPELREVINTGICPSCWDSIFPEEEE